MAECSEVKVLIRQLQRENTDHSRQEAAQALGKLGSRAAIEPLLQMLGEPKETIRQAALDTLRQLGEEEVAQAVLDTLAGKRSGLAALVNRQDKARAVRPFMYQLVIGDETARRWAAEGLTCLGTPVVSPLLNILNHHDEDVRRWVAWILGELGDQRALSPLRERLSVLHQADTMRTRMVILKAIHKIETCESGIPVEGELGPGREVPPD